MLLANVILDILKSIMWENVKLNISNSIDHLNVILL